MSSHRIAQCPLWTLALSCQFLLGVACFAEDKLDLRRVSVRKGLLVVAGEMDAATMQWLIDETELVVYAQTDDPEAAARMRLHAQNAGLLGRRIYVAEGAMSRIGLASNLADAAVILGASRSEIMQRELLRVVHPEARVHHSSGSITKPAPKGMDDWSHPYHGPDNNPASTDELARAPFLTQFLAEPWYVPMPQVTVASGGRLFKAFGHIALKEREWPWLNSLVAMNAYNGSILWKRQLKPGFMIHRNTLVASPRTVYLADDDSCKLIDADDGRVRSEIRIPKELDSDGVWKWLAFADDKLYALIGEAESPEPTIRGDRQQPGWPWSDLGPGYKSNYRWGFGRLLVCFHRTGDRILWSRKFDAPIDSRAVCMATGKIYAYSDQKFLACIDASSGEEIWRNKDPKFLSMVGKHGRAQNPRLGFSSSAFAKANAQGIYFAGPQREQLVAVSAGNGRLMWSYPHGNFQLVLREDGLYAMGRTETSKVFDYTTGKVLADLECYRGNCTRATASVDSIFTRGYRHTGTMRLDLRGNYPRRIPLMRPACQDGVVVSNGLTYWGPWMCDCNHSLVGVISLAPAGPFDFAQVAGEDRITRYAQAEPEAVGPVVDERDWAHYRGSASRAASSQATIADRVEELWRVSGTDSESTAPVTADGMVFWSGLDGVVHARDAATGELRWTMATEGAVRFPPELEGGRLFVGSSDGFVYALDAASGQRLWRFQAAPQQRRIMVHGRLMSTWPIGGGVLVDRGVVYAAAGITSYDGTHVYALDATSGEIRWQNNSSGRLAGEQQVSGVSVQGHLLLHDDALYLAGGNVVSPAKYDLRSGECLNELKNEWWDRPDNTEERFPSNPTREMFRRSPRGRELFVVDGQVRVFDQLLYSPPEYGPSRYFGGHFLQASNEEAVIRGTSGRVVRLASRKTEDGKPIGIWQSDAFRDPIAMALASGSVVVAGQSKVDDEQADAAIFAVAALDLQTGRVLWSHAIPKKPVPWGLAVDRDGRVIVTLVDGGAVCFGG